ncbi:hypothetical protein [Clavibacter tessellarius]|uniref:hypothetical protein n=1 Tax=Clavibacter tessellarius TaxID=31965 RepID=UPI00324AB6F6
MESAAVLTLGATLLVPPKLGQTKVPRIRSITDVRFDRKGCQITVVTRSAPGVTLAVGYSHAEAAEARTLISSLIFL